MPEETLVEETKNTGDETPTGEVQPVEQTESPEELKARLAQLEKEREDYKNMALKYKSEAKEKTLETEEEYPDWDEQSKKFQKQTIELAQKTATEVTQKQVEKTNEKNAIASFIEKNPELADDKRWSEVVKHYQPRSKDSVQDIVKDLRRAYVLYQDDMGLLVSKGGAKPDVSDLGTVGKTTSKSATQGKTLTEGEKRIAKLMKVDPERLAEEDMTKPATIEIN